MKIIKIQTRCAKKDCSKDQCMELRNKVTKSCVNSRKDIQTCWCSKQWHLYPIIQKYPPYPKSCSPINLTSVHLFVLALYGVMGVLVY